MLCAESFIPQESFAIRGWVTLAAWADTPIPCGNNCQKPLTQYLRTREQKDHFSKRRGCLLASSFLLLAKNFLDLFTRTIIMAVCIRRHTYLQFIDIQQDTKSLTEDLLFDREGHFSTSTDLILQDLDKSIKASRTLDVTSSFKDSKPWQWSSHPWPRYSYSCTHLIILGTPVCSSLINPCFQGRLNFSLQLHNKHPKGRPSISWSMVFGLPAPLQTNPPPSHCGMNLSPWKHVPCFLGS